MGKLSGKLLLTKELRGRNTYEWQIGRSDCIDRYLGFDPQGKQKFFCQRDRTEKAQKEKAKVSTRLQHVVRIKITAICVK